MLNWDPIIEERRKFLSPKNSDNFEFFSDYQENLMKNCIEDFLKLIPKFDAQSISIHNIDEIDGMCCSSTYEYEISVKSNDDYICLCCYELDDGNIDIEKMRYTISNQHKQFNDVTHLEYHGIIKLINNLLEPLVKACR
jgi:hypothetical protein